MSARKVPLDDELVVQLVAEFGYEAAAERLDVHPQRLKDRVAVIRAEWGANNLAHAAYMVGVRVGRRMATA